MWEKGDALAYSNPTVLGRGAYGVAMAVTTPDAKRIAVKLIPKRTNFASTSDGRIAFAGRELEVMDKMKDAGARHVMVYNRGVCMRTCSRTARRPEGLQQNNICVHSYGRVSLALATSSSTYSALRLICRKGACAIISSSAVKAVRRQRQCQAPYASRGRCSCCEGVLSCIDRTVYTETSNPTTCFSS